MQFDKAILSSYMATDMDKMVANLEEGIIAGGGSAYVHAIQKISNQFDDLDGDEKTGVSLVMKALEAPLKQIITNAGLEGTVILK